MDKGYIFMGIGFITGLIISKKIIGSQKITRPTLENIDNFPISSNLNNDNENNENFLYSNISNTKLNSNSNSNSGNLYYNYGENNYTFYNKNNEEDLSSSPYNKYIKSDPFSKK